jgi:hypothetical protein
VRHDPHQQVAAEFRRQSLAARAADEALDADDLAQTVAQGEHAAEAALERELVDGTDDEAQVRGGVHEPPRVFGRDRHR